MRIDSRTRLTVLILLVLGVASFVAAQDQEKKDGAGTVEVKLTEYAIEMPESLPAGPTTFVIHNEGQKNHRFVVQDEAGEESLSGSVRPRATVNLEVALKPGKYKVYCPIGSHEAKGMTRTLVVTETQKRG